MGKKFYTPDGFTDILPDDCAYKRTLEGSLRNLFAMNGYQEIETPGVEYCDVYSATGFVKEEDLYKFTDQKGRLLCARYDGTVPAARFAAGIFRDEPLPIRLSYIENMYRFNQMGGGKQSGFTQAGIELLGARGAASDAEVIALAIKSALEIGITDLQVSIGQTEFFDGLARQFNLSDEDKEDIKEAVSCKDSVMIEKKASGLNSEDRQTITMLTECSGTYDTIEQFEGRVTDAKALNALRNIRNILDILDKYGYTRYITVDLGLFGSVDYYTGVIFKCYTYEVGFPIMSGGRYDSMSKVFGRDLEAVGFSMSLTLAITAMMRQGKKLEKSGAGTIVGGKTDLAIATAEKLRAQGFPAILDTTGMNEDELNRYAALKGIETVLYMREGDAE